MFQDVDVCWWEFSLENIFFFAFSLLYAFLESWFRVDVNNKVDLTFFLLYAVSSLIKILIFLLVPVLLCLFICFKGNFSLV